MNKVKLTVILISIAILTGCAGSGPKDSRSDAVPEWFTKLPKKEHYLYGTATEISKDLQMAIDKAEMTATRKIAQTLEQQFNARREQMKKEIGIEDDSRLLKKYDDISEQVVSQVLSGVTVEETKFLKEGSLYRSYVLVSMPLGKANEILFEKMKLDEELYTEFQATKAYEKMKKAIKDYKQ